MSTNEPGSHAFWRGGNVVLQSGRTFRDMRIVYRTYGTLNADRSNVVVYPTSFAAQDTDIAHMIGPGRALDPERYFIVIPNLFGNGLSSSPSNTPWPDQGDAYPHVTLHDAVMQQRRMLLELWGIQRVALVYGWSMGAMQAYHWATLFPDAVERIAVVCGSARCAAHNRVFIEGVEAALKADPAWQGGAFNGVPSRGFDAMGRIYAGWALSQTFYRTEQWRELGFSSLEDFMIHGWVGVFSRRHASDLLAQFWTWKHGDISANDRFRHDLPAALASIRAHVLLMPGDQDLYFRVEDNADELPFLGGARSAALKPIESIWGHRAGNPVHNAADRAFIDEQVKALLSLPA
jgi:homoserine O-acetyltransferase/O-succinyltransferase